MILSRRYSIPKDNGNLIILANGPSLSATIDEHLHLLQKSNCMAVNFFANTEFFSVIKPAYYILADPHFFKNTADPNVAKLIDNIQNVSWNMTLLVPTNAIHSLSIRPTSALSIKMYNAVGIEGYDWLTNILFNLKKAMPRPRNILIPALMTGIWIGFKKINIAGADHTWTQSLSVDENNNVISIQPHFYKDNKEETTRIKAEYKQYRLHNILESMAMAFRSYHRIARFAKKKGVEIVNSTPGSFIDAFKRGSL